MEKVTSMKLFLYLFIVMLLSCSKRIGINNERTSQECNKEIASELCMEILKENKLLNFEPEITVIDSASHFYVVILPTSKMIKGGGGDFFVSKERCQITVLNFYQ